MKKTSLLALLLAACLLLSGCTLVSVDKKADEAQIIIDVNGEQVNKGTLNQVVEAQIAENEQQNLYYSYFGLSAGLPTDRATIVPLVIDSYVQNLVTRQKARELGLDRMTDEEKTEIETAAKESFDSLIDQVIGSDDSYSELPDEEKRQKAEAYAAENGVTLDTYIEEQTNVKMLEKLRSDTVKDVTVTEDELNERLNDEIESAKINYEASLSSYGYAVNNGGETYYTPAGYRMVKQILVKFTEEDDAAITTAQTALDEAQAALANAGDDADKAALEAAVKDAQKALDEATEKAKANIQDKVNEVMEKVKAEGADFDALVKEYNEDAGMPENGYAVCDGYVYFVDSFTEAAMKLQNVGDVSEPVLSDYGYHILKYDRDLPEGPVALDTVRESLTADILSAKQDECYDDAVAAWVEAADVKTYPGKM